MENAWSCKSVTHYALKPRNTAGTDMNQAGAQATELMGTHSANTNLNLLDCEPECLLKQCTLLPSLSSLGPAQKETSQQTKSQSKKKKNSRDIITKL